MKRLLPLILVAGCGWGYATTAPEARQLQAARAEAQPAPAPTLSTFRVRLLDAHNVAHREIHEISGKILAHDRLTPRAGEVEAARRQRVPLGVWILEVDPQGRDPEMATLDLYQRVQQRHRLRFIDRGVDGRIIYEYIGLK